MKIPFSIKYRPQIESGEYKVETESGSPAKVMDWEYNSRVCGKCIAIKITEGDGDQALLYTHEGKRASIFPAEEGHDLFLVTPEPELSEFEERIFKLLRQYKEFDIPLTPENIKAEASMLWPDFEKYFFDLYGKEGEGDSALRSFYYRGLADGKAKALKEIEQDPESSYAFKRGFEYGKEEALKDLPRWREWGNGAAGNSDGHPIALVSGAGGIRFVSVLGITGEKYIMLDDLKKLPGFKED